MAAEYMHVGIPVLNKKPNMVYNDWGKFWVNESVDAYDFKIEYLKWDEDSIFPEILAKQPHVAYSVDNIEYYADQAQQVIFGPRYFLDDPSTKVRLASKTKTDSLCTLKA